MTGMRAVRGAAGRLTQVRTPQPRSQDLKTSSLKRSPCAARPRHSAAHQPCMSATASEPANDPCLVHTSPELHMV